MALRQIIRARGVVTLLCAAVACAASSERMAAERDCRLRVVVGFVAASVVIDVASLGTAVGAQLRLVERLLPDLAVLEVSAPGDEAACGAALERLRGQPAIRSAEVERRRAPHSR